MSHAGDSTSWPCAVLLDALPMHAGQQNAPGSLTASVDLIFSFALAGGLGEWLRQFCCWQLSGNHHGNRKWGAFTCWEQCQEGIQCAFGKSCVAISFKLSIRNGPCGWICQNRNISNCITVGSQHTELIWKGGAMTQTCLSWCLGEQQQILCNVKSFTVTPLWQWMSAELLDLLSLTFSAYPAIDESPQTLFLLSSWPDLSAWYHLFLSTEPCIPPICSLVLQDTI